VSKDDWPGSSYLKRFLNDLSKNLVLTHRMSQVRLRIESSPPRKLRVVTSGRGSLVIIRTGLSWTSKVMTLVLFLTNPSFRILGLVMDASLMRYSVRYLFFAPAMASSFPRYPYSRTTLLTEVSVVLYIRGLRVRVIWV
jgi:hypothetical protein